MSAWVGVAVLCVCAAVKIAIWAEDRDRRRHVRQMGCATKVRLEAKLSEQELRIRAQADAMRDLIDGAVEEARAIEEARFFGELAQSDFTDTWDAIQGLEFFNPADWWKVTR